MRRSRRRPAAACARPAGLLRLWGETRSLFAAKPQSHPEARVSPLAFLSGTALLFVTLALIALATTWDCWQVIAGALLGSPYRTAVDRCLEGTATAIQVNDHYLSPATGSGAEQSSLVAYAARSCANPYASISTAIAFAAVAVLVAGTLALFWCWPGWSIRRRRLVPFPSKDLGALGAKITALEETSGAKFLLDAADLRVAGRAFGRPGRRYVVLSRGLATFYRTEPGQARAVIAHELGHLRNRDVDPAYAAVWAWRVFTVVTIVPMAVWALWAVAEGHGGTAWTYGWRTIAAAVLGLLVRGWLFRFRECLACSQLLPAIGRTDASVSLITLAVKAEHPALTSGEGSLHIRLRRASSWAAVMSACNVSILLHVSWPRMSCRWCRSRSTSQAASALSSSSAVRSRRFGIFLPPVLVRSGRHRPRS